MRSVTENHVRLLMYGIANLPDRQRHSLGANSGIVVERAGGRFHVTHPDGIADLGTLGDVEEFVRRLTGLHTSSENCTSRKDPNPNPETQMGTGFRSEILAIRKLRDAFPDEPQRALARRIFRRDFIDPDHRKTSQNVGARPPASIYSAIRRYDRERQAKRRSRSTAA